MQLLSSAVVLVKSFVVFFWIIYKLKRPLPEGIYSTAFLPYLSQLTATDGEAVGIRRGKNDQENGINRWVRRPSLKV